MIFLENVDKWVEKNVPKCLRPIVTWLLALGLVGLLGIGKIAAIVACAWLLFKLFYWFPWLWKAIGIGWIALIVVLIGTILVQDHWPIRVRK